ncbi:bifunctional DNA-formamidopyrimidine glycosylase/DNA-(apurinic or apyrimidinic site) lyase [Microterricola viridarii]|uniref:Formamidopyrimidine-DNA glycosylase n=1 Tax=Microterricola viridarii TaxID=412690 RepID=A0A0Y0MYN2_9MICO|nr:bifunctional DNA-formamidopyrimidine glycosylase/DNA-(apurinic or apyrimidinic site) lyase [Microterricola viridarii]AMB58169.1 formamidopyrimidine-DNA glycosylase [Microterricola viridarii]
MPELPEVEVVRAGLAPAVTGALVRGVEVFDERSLKRHDAASGSFEGLLLERRMLAAVRRGKFLWIPLDSGRALVTHLGMSGQVLLRSPGFEESGLLRIRLAIEHPEHGEFWVNFVDQRIFGSMAVDRMVPTDDGRAGGFSGADALGDTTAAAPWRLQLPGQVAHIARDPLDPAFSDASFFAALARKNTGIKRALLDQSLVSGIGNIYADEALWAARLHYEQPASSLSTQKKRTLLAEVRRVLDKALAEGGTSFDAQYVNVNGASGYFAHHLTAYGQQGKPCLRCGTPMKRAQFMNRGSHFCPQCQRLRAPRAGSAA